MREAALLAALFAVVLWMIDPLLGSFLHACAGFIIARFPGAEPRSLRGVWVTKFRRGNQQLTENARVKQLLNRIWGKIHCPAMNKHYEFRGSIRGDILIATYEVKGHPEAMDRGTFTLKLNNTGNALIGRYSWTHDETGEVNSDKYEWRKVPTP